MCDSSCGAALGRLINAVLALSNYDVTWDYAPSFLWSVVEPAVGIMCTCLPTMRALMNAIFRGAFCGLCSNGSADDEFGTLCKPPWPCLGSRRYFINELNGPSLSGSDGVCCVHAEAQGPLKSGTKSDNNDRLDVPGRAIHVQRDITVETGGRDAESIELSIFRYSHASGNSGRP